MIVALSGTSGVGKTTSVYEKAAELKKQFPNKTLCVLNELAILCPFAVNKETTEDSQLWIFTNQFKTELKLASIADIVVSDRTVIDPIAYSIAGGFIDLSEGMVELAKKYVHKYDKIYLKLIKNNPYNHDDGFREIDETFRKTIEEILVDLYINVFELGDKIEYC